MTLSLEFKPVGSMSRLRSSASGLCGRACALQIGYQSAGLEHLAIGGRERLAGQALSRRQIADDAGLPVDLDLVPAPHQIEDAGTWHQGRSHADLAAPESGREGLRDDA